MLPGADVSEDGQHRVVSLGVRVDQVDLQVGAMAVDDVLCGCVDVPLLQSVGLVAHGQSSANGSRLGYLDHVSGVLHDQWCPGVVDPQLWQLGLPGAGHDHR